MLSIFYVRSKNGIIVFKNDETLNLRFFSARLDGTKVSLFI